MASLRYGFLVDKTELHNKLDEAWKQQGVTDVMYVKLDTWERSSPHRLYDTDVEIKYVQEPVSWDWRSSSSTEQGLLVSDVEDAIGCLTNIGTCSVANAPNNTYLISHYKMQFLTADFKELSQRDLSITFADAKILNTIKEKLQLNEIAQWYLYAGIF